MQGRRGFGGPRGNQNRFGMRRPANRAELVLHGGNGGAGIAAAQDAAMHAELQRTATVQQVRPFERDLDEFALNEVMATLEEQAGTSHIGEFPAAVFAGSQCVRQL